DTVTSDIYTLSLHDALPILSDGREIRRRQPGDERLQRALFHGLGEILQTRRAGDNRRETDRSEAETVRRVIVDQIDDHLSRVVRSEEHTSELQSRSDLVCRL